MAGSLGKGCSEGWMKSWGGRRGNPSQKFILAEVHSLDYVSAVIEYPPNVLRIYCACEMWITVVFTISAGCADSLKNEKNKSKLIYSHEVNKVKHRSSNNEISNTKSDFGRTNLGNVGLMFQKCVIHVLASLTFLCVTF